MNAARCFLIAMVMNLGVALFADLEYTLLLMFLAVLCAGLWNSEVRKQVADKEQAHKSAVLQRLTNGRVK